MSAIFPPYSAADVDVLRKSDENGKRKVMRPNPCSLTGSAWTPIPIYAPSFVVPRTPTNGILYFRPFDRGDSTSAATLQATCYVGGPVLEISAPGIWWVWNSGTTCQAMILDATGAIVEGMTDGYTLAAHSQATLSTGTVTVLAAANAFRRMVTIQNNGSVAVRLRWDGTNPTTSTGFRLLPGAVLTMDGNELTRNAVTGIEESGSVVVDVVVGS